MAEQELGVSFVYSFENAPWFFIKPTSDELKLYDQHMHTAMYGFMQLLRKHPKLSPDAIVAPQLGGITAGELAMLRLRMEGNWRKNYENETKKQQQQPKQPKNKKRRIQPSVKLKQIYSTDPQIKNSPEHCEPPLQTSVPELPAVPCLEPF